MITVTAFGLMAALAQAAPCLNAANQAIANTGCIVFNSRGVPVDDTNTPTPAGALYVSDGSSVFGVTVSAGGMVQLWKANLSSGTWVIN